MRKSDKQKELLHEFGRDYLSISQEELLSDNDKIRVLNELVEGYYKELIK